MPSALITAGTNSVLLNCAGEMLAETLQRDGHFAASVQAIISTHSPIGTIRPVSSASGMNSPGMTNPRAGWFQRNSAS